MERLLEPEVMDSLEEAGEYDRMDHRLANEAFVERALELGAKGGDLLDLGTGPAVISVVLCQGLPDLKVVACDLSQGMLAIATQRVENAGLQGRIDLRRLDAKVLPFEDASFDGLLSNSLVHHLPDPIIALREMARVVRDDGLFLVRDLIRPETEERARELVREYAGEEGEGGKRMFYNSFRASLTLEEVEALVADLHLPGVRVVQSSDRHWTLERPAGGHHKNSSGEKR